MPSPGKVTSLLDPAMAPLARVGALLLVLGGLGACDRSPATAEAGGARDSPGARLDSATLAPASAERVSVPVAAVSRTPQDAMDASYPADIRPPAGTQYPCALTALPRDLPGVPVAERQYLDRTYARILRATQAKLLALRALENEPASPAVIEAYQATTERLGRALAADAPPSGLEPFQLDVTAALGLQRTFFRRASELRRGGGGMGEVYAVPEGREASRLLRRAWGRMRARYPGWSAETRDSIYHHLCALDLF